MKRVIALMVFVASMTAFASPSKQTPTSIIKKTTGTEDKVLRYQLLESEVNRQGKSYSVNGSLGIESLLIGMGLETNYIFNTNHQIGLRYVQAKIEITNTYPDYSYRDDYHLNSLGITYKYFPGNSFYLNPILSYNLLKKTESNSNNARAYKDKNTVNATLNIGNQWHWDNFTLGCSWIGVNANLVTFKDEIKEKTSSDKTHAGPISFNLLNLHLGISF